MLLFVVVVVVVVAAAAAVVFLPISAAQTIWVEIRGYTARRT